MSRPPALLVVGHGTRDDAGARQFLAFVHRLHTRAPAGVGVAGGFIELCRPPLTEAVASLVRQRHQTLVAVPLLLVAAGHAKGDIPGALARERRRHPGLSMRYGRPLGPHPVLLSLLEERLAALVAPPDRADTAVLLVGRGSTDPDANAEVHKVARLLWEWTGVAFVETAFVSLARPGVVDGLERVRLLGAKRVVVLPYFLFSGVLPDRVARQARGYAATNPDLAVGCAPPLGDTDALADLVLERYREAIDGDIRMNCDTCIHRIPMPGLEHRVGAPQTPHHHPDDPAHHADDAAHHAADAHHAVDAAGLHRHPHRHVPGLHPPEPDHVPLPESPAPPVPDVDLRHHGDREVEPGLVDLAVNVRRAAPPRWLMERLAASLGDLAAYPRPDAAWAAVAERHGRPRDEVLLTAGAAEAFVLLARAVRPRHPVVVHPQFTEPEAALRAAGHEVDRVVLPADGGFTLRRGDVPDDADLVLVGNPTNPTSVLHPAETLAALARRDRTLVVDEAFMDAVPGEAESVAGRRDLPGLIVVRSLTKTWALAGLRVGYVLGGRQIVEALARCQPLWSVSTPALVAAQACCSPAARDEAEAMARVTAAERAYLLQRLSRLNRPSLAVAGRPRGPFVLVHAAGGLSLRAALRRRGYAVRRGDTFPGLGPDWLRIAVRDRVTTDGLVGALEEAADTEALR